MIQINPIQIFGNWDLGYALDLHTLSSIPIGDGMFDTTRSEIGEALYQYKYNRDNSQLHRIATTASWFVRSRYPVNSLSAIIPVPPSEYRSFQPVAALANEMGKQLNIPCFENAVVRTRSGTSLKNVDDPDERSKLLRGAFRMNTTALSNKYVLVVDDLYRSGSTLNEICNVLRMYGNVRNISVITMTKTRTKR